MTGFMEKAGQANITRGGWPAFRFILCLLLLHVFGIHLGQIAVIANPWPDNMAALFWNAPFGWRVFRRAGMVFFLLFMTLTLAGYPAFQSPASLMQAARDRLRCLDRRYFAIVIGVFLFHLPLLIAGGMFVAQVLVGLAFLVVGGALLINMGIAGCAVLGIAWIMAGFFVSEDTVRRLRDLDADCRPGAHILLKNGQNLACTSIREIGIYNGVLIRGETGSTFVPTGEIEPQSMIEALRPTGKIRF